MTTSTLTLTDFLLARIAEDEAAAKYAESGGPPTDDDWSGWWIGHYAHYQLHDPARVLAECEAKRRIVERERYRVTPGMPCAGHPGSYMPHGDYGEGYCMEPASRDGEESPSIRDLAVIYADHPDYRREWRP